MKGIYVLKLKLKKDTKISFGKNNKHYFKKGFYYYVGSAMNNVDLRIKRHLNNEKKLHWHIDYLLKNQNTKVIEYYTLITTKKEYECKIAELFLKKLTPIINFGSSDCKCSSHLFWSNNNKTQKV